MLFRSDVDVLTALQRFARSASVRRAEPGYDRFVAMVEAAPSLLAHSRRMWEGYASSLAQAVALDAGLDPADPRARALAQVVVAVLGAAPPEVDAVFDLLRHGWTV